MIDIYLQSCKLLKLQIFMLIFSKYTIECHTNKTPAKQSFHAYHLQNTPYHTNIMPSMYCALRNVTRVSRRLQNVGVCSVFMVNEQTGIFIMSQLYCNETEPFKRYSINFFSVRRKLTSKLGGKFWSETTRSPSIVPRCKTFEEPCRHSVWIKLIGLKNHFFLCRISKIYPFNKIQTHDCKDGTLDGTTCKF